MGEYVNYSNQEGVAILEIANPPVNAYTYELLRELDEAICATRMDESVHALVLTGQGERFFSAGADIGMLSSQSNPFRYAFALFGQEMTLRLENTPKITIAALNGHAIGGGLEVAMACDIRIAKKEGGRLGLAEVNLGVLPGLGGTQRLPRLIGKSKAMELATTGRQISFDEALDLGLVHHVYEAEGFFEQVLDYARQFVPPNKASHSVGLIKRAIHSGMEMSLAEGLAFEREALLQAFQNHDAAEGLKAFEEKRVPTFTGW